MSADPFVQAPYNSQSYNRYSYVFNNPLSFTDPSGYNCQAASGSVDLKDAAGNPIPSYSAGRDYTTLCGQDAYDYLKNLPNNQEWQNPYNQLPDQIYGAPHYAQGQHLLDQEAKELQAEIVIGATTFVVSAEGLLLVKLANTAKGAKTLDLVSQLTLSPAAQRTLLRTAMGASAGNKVDHVGGHPTYNNAVMDQLGRINPNLSPSRTAEELQKAADTLQNSIKQGTFGSWG